MSTNLSHTCNTSIITFQVCCSSRRTFSSIKCSKLFLHNSIWTYNASSSIQALYNLTILSCLLTFSYNTTLSIVLFLQPYRDYCMTIYITKNNTNYAFYFTYHVYIPFTLDTFTADGSPVSLQITLYTIPNDPWPILAWSRNDSYKYRGSFTHSHERREGATAVISFMFLIKYCYELLIIEIIRMNVIVTLEARNKLLLKRSSSFP